jgi:hypothetical protein
VFKFIWKHKRPPSQSNPEPKSNAGGIIIPDFKLFYRGMVIKTAWFWHKNRHEDQWNRTEDPDINPRIYSHLPFSKCAQNMYWRKDLLNKWCWENWISTCRRMKLAPSLSPCTGINSNWIKELNVRSEMVKLLQEKIGSTPDHIGLGTNFMNGTLIAQ